MKATLPHPWVLMQRGQARASAQPIQSWRVIFTPGRVVWVALAIALITLAATKEAWVAWFDHEINTVRVRGHFYQLNHAQLQNRAQQWLGKSFLMTDLNEIKADLESEPWVQHATVSRVWPGNIVAQITEQQPIAYWGEDALLNDRGQLFFPAHMTVALDLPKLVAPSIETNLARLEIFQTWQKLLPRLASFGVQPEQLTQTARGAWEIELDNGIAIALGTEELDARIDRLGKVLATLSLEELQRVARIDVRYPNGATVKWKSIDHDVDEAVVKH